MGLMAPVSLLAVMMVDQHRLVGYRVPDRLRADETVAVDGQVGHPAAEALLQVAAGVEDRVVLDCRRNDVAPPLSGKGVEPRPLMAALSLSVPPLVKTTSPRHRSR